MTFAPSRTFPGFAALALGAMAFTTSFPVTAAQAGDYVWSGSSLYNGTHPTSPNPWTTEWVENPDGSKSLEVSITKGAGYYNYIVIPQKRLGAGTDFTAELTFRVKTPTALPKTFYMFARNSKSASHDLWQRWVGEPGEKRTISFPMQLPPIEGGEWTIYLGTQGTGAIIIDSLVVKEGRNVANEAPQAGVAESAALPKQIPLATGSEKVIVELPRATGETTVLPVEGVLVADNGSPVSDATAEANSTGLQKLFDQARKIPGAKSITIPKGVYRFSSKAAIRLDGVQDLTIDGQGSEFIFQKLYRGECFMIANNERILFKHLFVDWDWTHKPIASLAEAVSISEDRKSAEFIFPDLAEEQIAEVAKMPWMGCFTINPKTLYRNPQLESKYLYLNSPKLQADGKRIRATFSDPQDIEVGKSYCVRHLYYEMNAFRVSDSRHLTFDGVTIYSMPGMGWFNSGATHHWQIINSNIVHRPGSRRPLTTAADGIHTGESRGNMIIRNCEFTGLGDDAINLHDNSWQGGLERGANNKQLKFQNSPKHRLRLEPGDVVRFFKPDFSPSGVELTVSGTPTFEGKPNAYAPTATMTVDFTTPVPEGLSPLSVAINTRFNTENVTIAECRFIRLFGRGILFAGNNATFEKNLFKDVYNTPIQIQTDIVENHWGEGSGSANLVVRDNIFDDCNFAGRWEGAIVYAGGRFPWGPTSYPIYQKFLIENNHFINAPGPAIALNFSNDILIRNNTVELKKPAPNHTPYAGTVSINYSGNVEVNGNTWTDETSLGGISGVVYDKATTQNISVAGNRTGSTN